MADKVQPLNIEELLAKAEKPSADAMLMHPFYKVNQGHTVCHQGLILQIVRHFLHLGKVFRRLGLIRFPEIKHQVQGGRTGEVGLDVPYGFHQEI